jgi:O-antigen/teichoic acid export membrane protein
MIAPIGYIVKVMLSHDLSVADIGALYGIISLLTLLTGYADLGMSESLYYFLPKYAVQKEYKHMKYILLITFLVHIISGIALSLFLYFWSTWLANSYFSNPEIVPLVQIAAFYFLWLSVMGFVLAVFGALQYVKFQKGIEMIRSIIMLIGTMILFFTSPGEIVSYMWCWVLGVCLSALIWLLFISRQIYTPYLSDIAFKNTNDTWRHFLKYSLATFLTGNVSLLLSQIDTQLVIYLSGVEQAGYYSNYLSLINIPFIFLSPIIAFLFPVISELAGKKDDEKIKLVFRLFSLYFWIIGIWVTVFFYTVGPSLAITFFSYKFEESGYILQYSAPFMVFAILIQLQSQILWGVGKAKQKLIALSTVLPINIFLNIFFISVLWMDTRGSALAVGISWIPLYLIGRYFSREYIQPLDLRMIVSNIFWAVGLFLLSEYLHSFYIPIDRSGHFMVVLFAILGSFTIFIVINFRLLREFIQTFRSGLLSR